MNYVFVDKTLVCQDCGRRFLWTAQEQEYAAVRGFEHAPKRCHKCRIAHERDRKAYRRRKIICARCGKEAYVPFAPRAGRTLYCQACYQIISRERGAA